MAKKGFCINVGNCDVADFREEVEIAEGHEFRCPNPGCNQVLQPHDIRPPFPWKRWVKRSVIALGCAGVVAGIIFLLGRIGGSDSPEAAEPISIVPTTAKMGEPVLFKGLDGKTWEWELDDDGMPDGNTQSMSFTYYQAGNYTITLVVDGVKYTEQLQVIGDGPVPVRTVEFDVHPEQGGKVGEPFQFVAQTPGASSWDWDFDADGTYEGHGETVGHVYNVAGTYKVALRVDGKDVGSKKVEVKVKPNINNPITEQSLATALNKIADGSSNGSSRHTIYQALLQNISTSTPVSGTILNISYAGAKLKFADYYNHLCITPDVHIDDVKISKGTDGTIVGLYVVEKQKLPVL
jgi:PKD repeat protein